MMPYQQSRNAPRLQKSRCRNIHTYNTSGGLSTRPKEYRKILILFTEKEHDDPGLGASAYLADYSLFEQAPRGAAMTYHRSVLENCSDLCQYNRREPMPVSLLIVLDRGVLIIGENLETVPRRLGDS
jgi:hypothetical protein